MPNPVYGKKDLAWVKPYDGAAIKYGFRSGVDDNVKIALGHEVVLTGNYPAGFVLGANMPKPPRASKQFATGVESSWCSSDSITDARTLGWTVAPGRFIPGGSSTKKAKVVYVTIDGIKYAWRMPTRSYNKIAPTFRAFLGVKDAQANDDDLVFGASYPKLPRVSYALDNPVGATVSTFCDPSALNNLPDGWTTVRAQSKSRY